MDRIANGIRAMAAMLAGKRIRPKATPPGIDSKRLGLGPKSAGLTVKRAGIAAFRWALPSL
jgi:hypothetical protein